MLIGNIKRKLYVLFLILNLAVISTKGADVELRNVTPGYRPLELVFISSVKVTKKIPKEKYVRLTINYTLNNAPEEISLVLNGSLSINFIYFSITKMRASKPRLYIIGLTRIPQNTQRAIFRYYKILSDKECNALLLDYNPNLSLNIGEETVLGRTYKENPPTQSRRDIGFYQTGKSNRKLPRIEFKIKAELVDSPDMYMLKRDLSYTLKNMTLKQQHSWLNKELNRRAEMHRKGNAAIGDLNTICKYRMKLEKKLGLR